jgi:hypothetical protein
VGVFFFGGGGGGGRRGGCVSNHIINGANRILGFVAGK